MACGTTECQLILTLRYMCLTSKNPFNYLHTIIEKYFNLYSFVFIGFPEKDTSKLEDYGFINFKPKGEFHANNP